MNERGELITLSGRELESIDQSILTVLQEHCRITNVDLAKNVGLSSSPCLVRTRDLEADGFIQQYLALLYPRSVGIGVCVFAQVSLVRQMEASLKTFESASAQK